MHLLPDTQDLIEVKPQDLIELNRIPLPGAHEAQHPISPVFPPKRSAALAPGPAHTN